MRSARLPSSSCPPSPGLLALRFMQGIGAAATRVITISIVRDVYGGRMMAEVMSLVMMVFMIVPVIAPSVGQLIMIFAEWHMIFVVICLFALLVATLVASAAAGDADRVEHRRPFTVASIVGGFRIVLTNRISLCYSLAASFIFGALFGFINSAQQILVGIYGLGIWFPLVFAGFAGTMAVASFTNSRLVKRYGMRRLSHGALIGFVLASLAWAHASIFGALPFWLFVVLYGAGHVPVRPDRPELQRHGHGAARPCRRHRLFRARLHPDDRRRSHRSIDRTGLRRHGRRRLPIGFLSVSVIGLMFVLVAEKGRLFSPHNPSV